MVKKSSHKYLLVVLVLSVFLFLILVSSFFNIMLVRGDSMSPILKAGDVLLVWRGRFGLYFPFSDYKLFSWGEPHRGELLVVEVGEDRKKVVKRCAGIPGDRLEIKNGFILIGNEYSALYPHQEKTVFSESIIPEGWCFLLGENLLVSEDSRDYGLVPLNRIQGLAFKLTR